MNVAAAGMAPGGGVPVISVKNVTVRFGGFTALADIDAGFAAGEIPKIPLNSFSVLAPCVSDSRSSAERASASSSD